MEDSVEVTSRKASMKAFVEVMDTFVKILEALMEVTSTEVFMEASVEDST